MEQNMKNAFRFAIETGNIELFDVLAKDFNSFTQEDKDYLIEATVLWAPNTDFIQHVLDYGYDINHKDEDGWTLLHLAAISDFPENARFFINKGIDKEIKDKYGMTPLIIAAQYGDSVEVLKTLIELGCDEKVCDDDGENLLICAAGRNPNPEITKYLIERGHDIEARDKEGFTPLLNAAMWQSNSDVIDILIDAGADIDAKTKKGDSLFHHAAYNESCEVVHYISSGFLPSQTNNDGITCFEVALCNAKTAEVMKVFLREMKQEHLFLAAYNENPEILETLILSGYDVNTQNLDGITLLMCVAQNNKNPKVISSLMYHRGNINTKDNKGRTILHYAASNKDATIYNWMLERDEFKAFIDEKDDKGNVPSYYKEHPEDF